MILVKRIILFFVLCATVQPLFAQPNLPSEEVEVIKDFEARLEDSEKIDAIPELPELDTTIRNLTYTVQPESLQVPYRAPKIRPLAMKRDKVTPAYNGFLKLGYGLPHSPYAELAYNNSKNKNYDVGGQLKYHTANRKSLDNQRFKDIFGRLNGTYYWDEGYAVGGEMGYALDEVHFYGYDHDVDTFGREEVKQQFKVFDAKAKFFNGERTQGDINYAVGFDFYALNDNYASSETGTDIELSATKWFNENHPLTIVINTDFTNFEDTAKQNLNNFSLNPTFTYHAQIFKLKIGANLTSHKDVFNVFPDVEASVNIVGNQLSAYTGVSGGLHKNSFRNTSDFNPFVVSRYELRNTQYLHVYGGVKGNLKVVDYQIQAGYKSAKDLALFLNDVTDTIRFNVLYDTVNIFNIEGTLQAKPMKNLNVMLTLSQNIYSPKNQDKAWHLPATEFNLAANYLTMRDKLTLKGELFVQNGVNYIDLQNNQDKLNALFDLSLGAEYNITKHFNVFFEANNLVSNRRQRWYRYPTFGINFLAGVTARF